MTNINTFQGDVFIHEYIKHSGDDNNLFGFSGTDTFKIATGGADRLTVDSNGYAHFAKGIRLPEGDSSINIQIPNYIYHTGDENNLFGFSGTDTFKIATAGSDRLTVDSGGTVTLGVNMYIPDYIYHVGDSNSLFGFSGNDTFKIKTAGTDRLTINSSGNVGIGKSPTSKLDVNGTVQGAYNSDTTSYFGRSAIGYTGHSDHASVSHIDSNSGGGYALLQSSNGTTYLNCVSGQNIAFRVSNSDKMRMDSNGRLGIGTTTVRTPLHVNGGVNPVIGNGGRAYFAFFDAGGGNTIILNTSYWGETTSIYASHGIVCGSYIASLQGTIGASDKRIKKEIVDIEDDSALETLRLLKPKKYKYVDEVQRGTDPVWGFIAQEVDATLPYATQVRTECIPNIYELANVSDSNVITFTNFDTSNLYSNTMVLKVYDVEGMEHLVNIAEVVDGTSIRIEEDLSKLTGSVDETGNAITQTETTTLTLEEYEALALDDITNCVLGESNTYTKTTTTNIGNNLFVYGQEVSDFLFLKKDAIFTVATAALQEVDRQLQAERVKVATLETQVASVLTRLDALESA